MDPTSLTWTRQRLESLIGQTETLTLEFKSVRSLMWSNAPERDIKLAEAAKDAAAMANEQGGTIIYGIEEGKRSRQRRAVAIEAGFSPDDASREWYLQFIRDRVHPSLPEIDAVEVDLDDGKFALVVLVPQARGVARQTEDLYFWRRDAQGCHRMTVQEIEDVRNRAAHPSLKLEALTGEVRPGNGLVEAVVQIEVVNTSPVTATFAVLTAGIAAGGSVSFHNRPEWDWLSHTNTWHIARSVIASGSSPRWSPLTPGYNLAAQEITVKIPPREVDALGGQRLVGLVRLDDDSGSSLWALHFRTLPNVALTLGEANAAHLQELGLAERLPKVFEKN
jgi:hypothetical protein